MRQSNPDRDEIADQLIEIINMYDCDESYVNAFYTRAEAIVALNMHYDQLYNKSAEADK